MTFIALSRPMSDKERSRVHPVIMRVSPVGARRQHATLTVRTHLFPEPDMLAWWANAAFVTPLLGTDKDDGFLKIVPGGTYRLTGVSTGRGKHQNLSSMANPARLLLELPNMPPQGTPRMALEFDYGEDWLVLTLPAWARRGSDAKPIVTVPESNPFAPTGKPYRGITASTGLGDKQGVRNR